jgi:hypothetical protein
MADEFEGIWKEALVEYWGPVQEFTLRNLGKPGKIFVRIIDIPAKIRTEDLSNTSLERYR